MFGAVVSSADASPGVNTSAPLASSSVTISCCVVPTQPAMSAWRPIATRMGPSPLIVMDCVPACSMSVSLGMTSNGDSWDSVPVATTESAARASVTCSQPTTSSAALPRNAIAARMNLTE
ncbi:hypothetical protein ACFPRL_07965 [Pseudoclavibacter helvolus]